jgi:hypothetical protein
MELLMTGCIENNKKSNTVVVTCPVRFETTVVVVNCTSAGRMRLTLIVCD